MSEEAFKERVVRWSAALLAAWCFAFFSGATGLALTTVGGRETLELGVLRSPSRSAEGKTLEEAYRAALARSESVGVQDELLVQADELKKQSVAAVLPTVSGSATFLRQAPSSSAGASNFFPTAQNTAKITADQPLFRGFREFAAIRQRNAQSGVQKFALQDAARQLFYNTATAYYNVLTLSSDERQYLNEIEVNERRLKELQGFMAIGRSRLSEVLTQKAQIASLQAQLESTRGQLENAKETLAFYTGWDREAALRDTQQVPASTDPVSAYLARVEQRPDVKEASANVQAFEESIPLAWGQHLPSADLIGNYYFTRPGLQKDSNWDVELALTVPIFQGGAVQSQVRQAQSVERQYELLLSQSRRVAEQEIRQFYDSLTADDRQFKKLEESASLSEQNYKAELRDYRNGLVTNLDVLQAITAWQDSLRSLSRTEFAVKLDYVKLQAASAQRPEIFIESTRDKK